MRSAVQICPVNKVLNSDPGSLLSFLNLIQASALSTSLYKSFHYALGKLGVLMLYLIPIKSGHPLGGSDVL